MGRISTELLGCLLALVMGGSAALSAPAGITGVVAEAVRLVAPPESTQEQVLRYGLGFLLQVAPDRAALLCNVRMEGLAVVDYENGADVIIFDHLHSINPSNAVAIARNERYHDAEGKQHLVVRYPLIGGFVPLGALGANGGPHPHAGTGFALCQAISFPVDERGHFNWGTERVHRCELYQFSYDGERFTATRDPVALTQSHPVVADTSWRIAAPGITSAIPDGDDLLLAAVASDEGGSCSGVVRWCRTDGIWQPVEFSPVTPRGEGWAEASLVRDVDGALLLSARGSGGDRSSEVRVWRRYQGGPQWRLVFSTPEVRVLHLEQGGPEWRQVLSVPGGHSPGPISINAAADGTPYIAANLPDTGRETLCVWALNPARSGLEAPITVRAARAEFSAPTGEARWMVDHPSGAVVRLGDGAWHALLAYRVLSSAEFQGAHPPSHTGCYVVEVISSGPPLPPWRFE